MDVREQHIAFLRHTGNPLATKESDRTGKKKKSDSR